MYEIGELLEIFQKHAEEVADRGEEEFNLPLALATICYEIKKIKESPSQKEGG
jgi:hypothetical protein